jgi:predicted RNA methylase
VSATLVPSRAVDAQERHALVAAVRRLASKARDYRGTRRRLRAGRVFDENYGTRTAENWRRSDIPRGILHRKLAVPYEATPPETVLELIGALPIEHRDYAFVDIGAGMGRVVMLASTFPFRLVVGVEFVPELVRIAQENLEIFPDGEIAASAIELRCTDAADYQFPSGAFVLYLYNPFSLSMLCRILANVVESVSSAPRNVYVILLSNEKAEAVLAAHGFEQVRRYVHRWLANDSPPLRPVGRL